LDGNLCCLLKVEVDYCNCRIQISQLSTVKEYFKNKIFESVNNKLKVDTIKFNLKSEIYYVLKINDSTTNSNNDKQVNCKLTNCNKLVEKERIIQHIGQHIINNHILKDPNVCGFCGQIG
jgi:hypothetical protein